MKLEWPWTPPWSSDYLNRAEVKAARTSIDRVHLFIQLDRMRFSGRWARLLNIRWGKILNGRFRIIAN